ncbi:hypothetical protein SISSUDRAFT_1067128 [Sistotremastrum suecicum HHB10207 ss-3]|uniref:Uncharacterized protein n=1 Tax=Sistotremastrum suecicum HHB10207 ss-3 TaxID=1314776 RepID=A0A165XGX1_9AGAM|nr:hypothetical protein SISSUDRAFT_1067128 [Sistotremastrum suecicum HHB10207 ss-3]
MTGLLYQLRNLATSFEGRATILLATWEVGVVLAAGIAAIMIGTTYHAVRYEGSVFEGLVSQALVGDVDVGLAKGLKMAYGKMRKLGLHAWRKTGMVVLLELLKGCWKRISRLIGIKRRGGWSDNKSSDELWWRRATKALRKWMKNWRIRVKREFMHEMSQMTTIYLELIAEASDPILLERAAASFRYRDLVQYGEGPRDQFEKAYSRLMATDTSFRVRETVSAQLSRFSVWATQRRKEIDRKRESRAVEERLAREGHETWIARSKKREEEAKQDDEEEHRAFRLTAFLRQQQTDDIYSYFVASKENYLELLDLFSLPRDKLLAECICINNHNIFFGYPGDIFCWSLNRCVDLLDAHKADDITRILSHVDLFSAVRSVIRAKRYITRYDDVLSLIIGDRRTDVLHFLAEFISRSARRDWILVDPLAASSAFLITVGYPPQFPSDLDISSIVTHVARNPSWENWHKVSDVVIAYLVQCDISTLSDRSGIYHFLQQCVHLEFSSPFEGPDHPDIRRATPETRDTALTLLNQYEALFVLLPPSPPLPFPDEAAPCLAIHTLDDLTPSIINRADPDPPRYPSTSAPLPLDHHVINLASAEL